ncbi:8642_t:CDS:2 [Entrophospora sp. SA101]|nr:8642_t:CDS:2 [Entrophospora sp. SA101]
MMHLLDENFNNNNVSGNSNKNKSPINYISKQLAILKTPWHDTTGNTKWNGQRYYRKANEYDDNIELIGKAKFIKDDFDLHPS